MPVDVTDGHTSVFWDVEDFPLPEGRKVRDVIETVLKKKGFNHDVRITVYGETNPFSDRETVEGRFPFIQKRTKYWRLNKMLIDIGLWAVDNPHPIFKLTNLMVRAKTMEEETEFVNLLWSLASTCFNVFLVLPDDFKTQRLPLPIVQLAWDWRSLLEAGEPLPFAEYDELVPKVVVYLDN